MCYANTSRLSNLALELAVPCKNMTAAAALHWLRRYRSNTGAKHRLKCEDATEPVTRRDGSLAAVDRCEGSFGTRGFDASLLWLRARGLPANTRDKHIGAQRGARGLAAFAETCLQQQRSAKATARRAARIAKRRNSHSALSSLCSTHHQEHCSEAASARTARAPTPSPRQARAALQGTVITGASRTAADEQ